jgi:predicted DNA-binding transcriptional regulator AlpA
MPSRSPTPEQIAEELDGLIETRDVERTTGYTRRWISELIARGRFPPPDVPGRLGSAHRWRRSTIRRYLDSVSQCTRLPP